MRDHVRLKSKLHTSSNVFLLAPSGALYVTGQQTAINVLKYSALAIQVSGGNAITRIFEQD